MNKTVIHLLILIIVFALFLSCTKSPEDMLVGEWSGTDNKGQTALFIFHGDGNAEMVFGDRVINGENIDGTVTWKIYPDYDPIQLDLLVYKPSKEPFSLPMIMRFISDTEIQIAVADTFTFRPTEFSSSDIINLSKQ